jgi:hypothetical protein
MTSVLSSNPPQVHEALEAQLGNKNANDGESHGDEDDGDCNIIYHLEAEAMHFSRHSLLEKATPLQS